MISTIFMAFLFLVLLPLLASPATADPLHHICGNTGNFISNNSTYSSNLNILLANLSSNASATGFATYTTGSIPDRISGLALCRGDTDIANCSTCISIAMSDIQQLCPNNKDAMIWYTNCQLRYSNQDFLYAPDVTSNIELYMYTQNVSAEQLLRFETLTSALMGNMSDFAVRNTSRLFATGETVLTEGNIIYGLVQCARDLSVSDCRTCLQDTVNQITKDPLIGKRGARTLGKWCSMRYESNKFYNGRSMLQLTSAPPPASVSPTNGSSTANSTRSQADASHGGTTAPEVI